MTKTVAIDARWLRTGLGTYTFKLVEALSRMENRLLLRAIVTEASEARFSSLCASRRVQASAYGIWEQIAIPLAARGCDLLHVPHYNAPLLSPGKLVVSIHDLIHLMPEGHNHRCSVWAYAWAMLHLVARRANHIVTGSEDAKRQIVERLGVRESKVTTIYHGVSSEFRKLNGETARAAVSHARVRQSPYMLCVSALRPHKNLIRLLAAATRFWERTNSVCDLLIIGSGEQEKACLLNECGRLHIAHKVFFIADIADDLLPSFYAAAQFLVMPSLAEGFGLPIVEAMACGTPVICSRASSLPEVGGDAVLYFDPLNVEDMANAMERVSASAEMRALLQEKGLKRAQGFSWLESARKHDEVYSRVLEN